MEIEDEANVDLTGETKHGFKRGRKVRRLQEWQSLARALDQGKFTLMADLDLSSNQDCN